MMVWHSSSVWINVGTTATYILVVLPTTSCSSCSHRVKSYWQDTGASLALAHHTHSRTNSTSQHRDVQTRSESYEFCLRLT